MSEAAEFLEQAEHAAHAEHGHGGKGHGGGSAKKFGLTMAIIGVLVAFCAAMVGGERNEMTKVMIAQTQVQSLYSGASTKFRIVMIDAERFKATLATAASDPIQKQFGARVVALYEDYAKERDLTKNWSESYQPIIDAHFEATEYYEKAQLVAEVGIVIASIAVLLSSQAAWGTGVGLGTTAILIVAFTFFHTEHKVQSAEEKMEETKGAYTAMRKAHVGGNEDEDAIAAIRAGLHLPAPVATSAEGHGAEGHGATEEHHPPAH